MTSQTPRSRLLLVPVALVILFETWVWGVLVVVAQFVATILPWDRLRDAARRIIGRLPAFVAVLLFGLPLMVSEFGAFISVVLMATGHLFMGAALYVAMKIFGLCLVPLIFEITREKLMTLPWFAYLFAIFERVQAWARQLIAPYRKAAVEWLRRIRDDAWSFWVRLFGSARELG